MTFHSTTALSTPDGMRLFRESDGLIGCLRLLVHFVTQRPAYCGPATAAMILNAAGIERPPFDEQPLFRLYTQDGIVTDYGPKELRREVVAHSGHVLALFPHWMVRGGLLTRCVHAQDTNIDQFRLALRATFQDDACRFIVANYHRPSVGQEGGGHFSPLGAFHRKDDCVLILDVARYKYPPVWVPVTAMFRAMQEIDTESGRSRGFVEIERV